jgi:hypothetical protein
VSIVLEDDTRQGACDLTEVAETYMDSKCKFRKSSYSSAKHMALMVQALGACMHARAQCDALWHGMHPSI